MLKVSLIYFATIHFTTTTDDDDEKLVVVMESDTEMESVETRTEAEDRAKREVKLNKRIVVKIL